MKKKWIVLYFIVMFLPFIAVLVLGKVGFFEEKPSPDLPKGPTVNLYCTESKTVQTLPLKDYLWGVLAGEMPASYPQEALKAQVVASYSYLLHRKASIQSHPESDFGHGGDVCDDPAHCKAYLSPADAAEKWGVDWLDSSEPILNAAVEEVLGTAVLYDDAPANTVFHAISGGKTESAKDVWGAEIPYLPSLDSSWDRQAKDFYSEVTLSRKEFSEILKQEDCTLGEITHTSGGSVKTVRLGGKTHTGQELRTLLGLRSTRFSIEFKNEQVIFKVRGYGHQVGMSQYGARVLAEEGYSYQDILAYYYPNTALAKYYFDE
ncbi:MAG: stage II sporulation protein D [Clostridia bacterium]|nr:stage II sporulation protein D [Clostridia bacterium]